MSSGHSHASANLRHPHELKAIFNNPSFQEMWARQFKVDTTNEIPDTAGYNVSGSIYYLDREFVRRAKAGDITVPHMTANQIFEAMLRHERFEKCALDADNDINLYPAAHEYATLFEHEFVRSCGATPRDYEKALAGIIHFNQIKPITNPPLDLACAPLLDDPDRNDKRVLANLRRIGVPDASKVSKKSVGYSHGKQDRCGLCASYQGKDVGPCRIVDGLVRAEFWCREFEAKENQDEQGLQPGGPEGEVAPGTGDPGGSEDSVEPTESGDALEEPGDQAGRDQGGDNEEVEPWRAPQGVTR